MPMRVPATDCDGSQFVINCVIFSQNLATRPGQIGQLLFKYLFQGPLRGEQTIAHEYRLHAVAYHQAIALEVIK
jgi:hypothetical protein